MLLADNPAGAEIMSLKKAVGPSTICVCRLCLARQRDPGNPTATPLRFNNSFLPWQANGTCPDEAMIKIDLDHVGHLQRWRLRTDALHEEQRQHCAALPPGEQEKYKQSIGVNDFDSGLRVSGLSRHGAPIDFMHAEAEGNAPRHLLGFLFVAIKVLGWFSLADFNASLRDHQFPRGCHPQPVREASIVGNGTLARSDATYTGMTAHDMMYFVVHSVAIIGPLIPSDQWGHDIWRCWCLHATYFTMLLQRTFTLEQVRRLDVTIWNMQELFLQIPHYYDIWVPNFHYATHFPLDILLWGPPRLYCCFRFEAENQVYIQAGRHTNFKSLLSSMAEKVAVKRALDLRQGAAANVLQVTSIEWLVEDVGYGTSTTIDSLWDGGWLVHGRTAITVRWLMAVQCGHFEYRLQRFVLLMSEEEVQTLTRIIALFDVEDKIYVRLQVFGNSILKHDPDTGQLWAFNADLPREGPSMIRPFNQNEFLSLCSQPAPHDKDTRPCTLLWALYL